MARRVRDVTAAERATLERIVRATTAAVRLVERARIVLLAPELAAQLGVAAATARHRIERFTASGRAGPADGAAAQRRGSAKARGRPPQPAGADVPPPWRWTLARRQEELNKDGLPLKRSQTRRLLNAAHLPWQKPRTWRERDDRACAETTGASVRRYNEPPPGSTVRCLDERGPVAATPSPAPRWTTDAHRPHCRPDCARHGYRWADGALNHRTGDVSVQTADRRNTAPWWPSRAGLAAFAPAGEVYRSVDGLPCHWTLDTMLWHRGHPRFHCVPLPTAAAGRNLIAGCWKLLTQRARAGRASRRVAEVEAALHAGVADWNRRPSPLLRGRPAKPRRQFKRAYLYRTREATRAGRPTGSPLRGRGLFDHVVAL